MSDQLFLYISTAIEVQMKIDTCGLEIIVA